MKFLGNLIWIIVGGLIMWAFWVLIGIIYCITIIGLPFGKQAFKLAGLSLAPFGKKVIREKRGATRFLFNIIWIIFGGLELAICHFIFGLIFTITIIGYPFGKQQFKLAKLSFAPFGIKITK